jgi:hypothetical protein
MAYIEDAEVKRAEAILEPFNATVTSVRNNADLSREGRDRAIAAAYFKADEAMSSLRESLDKVKVKTATDLIQEIFGAASAVGADAIGARDADDRAAMLEGASDALPLLARAEANGDQVLARAIALRAYSEQGIFGDWHEVLDAYTATHPNVAQKIEELAATQRQSTQSAVHAGIIFSVWKPSEIERWSGTAIRAAAGV